MKSASRASPSSSSPRAASSMPPSVRWAHAALRASQSPESTGRIAQQRLREQDDEVFTLGQAAAQSEAGGATAQPHRTWHCNYAAPDTDDRDKLVKTLARLRARARRAEPCRRRASRARTGASDAHAQLLLTVSLDAKADPDDDEVEFSHVRTADERNAEGFANAEFVG